MMDSPRPDPSGINDAPEATACVELFSISLEGGMPLQALQQAHFGLSQLQSPVTRVWSSFQRPEARRI